MLPPKIHVFGGSGAIGSRIITSLKSFGVEVAQSNRSRSIKKEASHYQIDLASPNPIIPKDIWDVDIFVFAAGLNASEYASERGRNFMVNEAHLVRTALESGKIVVYFSSSRVSQFLENVESIFPSATMNYVGHKLDIEEICALYGKSIVFRPGKVVSKDFLQYRDWLNCLSTGQKIQVSSAAVCNPVHIDDVTTAVVQCILNNHFGVFELWCINELSYFEIAKIFLEELAPTINFENFISDTKFIFHGVERIPNIRKETHLIQLVWEDSTQVFRDTIREFLLTKQP